jgi:omega-6 fatty acid desaturase (delta-12 desaturase)
MPLDWIDGKCDATPIPTHQEQSEFEQNLKYRSIQLDYPYTFTLILALPAAAFMVRLFILFHDCVHGSSFRWQKVSTLFGYFLGVLVFTPFEDWRFARLRHHVTCANLDARGFGDIWTMTLTEYENASKKKRLQYRLYRNPVVMLGLGALFMFLLTICLLCRGGFPVISGNTMSTI